MLIPKKSVKIQCFYKGNEVTDNFFKQMFIKQRWCYIVKFFDDGVKKNTWNISDVAHHGTAFNESSNLKGNVRSRPWWRKKEMNGLQKVHLVLD